MQQENATLRMLQSPSALVIVPVIALLLSQLYSITSLTRSSLLNTLLECMAGGAPSLSPVRLVHDQSWFMRA